MVQFLLDWIISARVKGMTAQHPANSQWTPAPRTMFLNGLGRVFRAGRDKPAGRRKQRRDNYFI